MQEITLSRIKQPPMMIGLFLAGLLLFAVVGVVRNVTNLNTATPIQNNVAAGLQAVQPAQQATQALQRAREQLPAFALASNPTASVQPTTANTPDWLAVAPGDDLGERMVWAGFWFSCMDITTSGEFVGLAIAPAAEMWRQLPAEQRLAVVQTCMTVQPEDVHPTPTPPAWLAVAYDGQGGRWVWIGDYFVSCPHIGDDFAYNTIPTDPALNSWNRLAFGEQEQVRSKCHE